MSLSQWFQKRLAGRQQAIQAVAQTSDGLELFNFLKKITGSEGVSFDPNPHTMAFKEGRRSVWVELQIEMTKETQEIIRQAEMIDRRQEQLARENEERFGEDERGFIT